MCHVGKQITYILYLFIGLKATLAVFVIVIVSVMKQLILHPTSSIKIISSGLTQKGLTWSLLFWSIYNTLNPLSLLGNFIRGMWNIVVSLIKLPLILACEFRSFCFMNDEKYSDTSYIRSFLSIWALIKDCIKESLYYCKLFYGGPRVIFDEFVLANKHSRHQLQFISLCGRKVLNLRFFVCDFFLKIF